MKVSIITVCYNSEKTIEKTIKSVLEQTYSDIEYIIVDGASNDSTVDIVREYEPRFSGRLRLVSEPDNGIYDAMNKGISMASGELVGIINSDDYYEKDAVEIMVNEYRKLTEKMPDGKYYIIYGMTRFLDNGVEKSISISRHEFLRESMISHPATFVNKRLYAELGTYDTIHPSAADYDFMLRMSENSDVVFTPVYNLIANFSLGGMCSTSRAYYDLLEVQRKHGIISERDYKTTIFKCKIYDWIKRK